jgi:hypothetical protein
LRQLDFASDDQMQRLSVLLRAWMLTQDLRRSRFALWTSDFMASKRHNGSAVPAWMEQFAPYISVRLFNYTDEVSKTPLSLSRHFASWDIFKTVMQDYIPLQSDLVRNVLLYNYGGLWLDSDSVPLRDLWNITAGLGLQFMPKFHNFISNNHIIYVACPHSPLSRRRLENIALFPLAHPQAWPREPSAGGTGWIFNDALSESVRAGQALEYNLSRDAEEVDVRHLPIHAWADVEFPFPITWFDNWWPCNRMTERNNSDFLRMTACNGTYIWHRLNKHIKSHPREFGPFSGADEFWNEIYGSKTKHDYKEIRSNWPVEPIVLTGGVNCRRGSNALLEDGEHVQRSKALVGD